VWFQDEARIGNKGRVCYRWWQKGERAPGVRQQGFRWTYIFSAIQPLTGDDVTLVLPSVGTDTMQLFLDHFASQLADNVHAVMVVDGAGWHDHRALGVPANVTLVTLPAYSPELNPVERVWLYLREKGLSMRVLDSVEAIIEACCKAWNRLVAETGRIASLVQYPWIMRVCS
jgi:hypothetical protein